MAMGGGSATKRSQLRAKDLLWWFIYRPPFLCVCVCVVCVCVCDVSQPPSHVCVCAGGSGVVGVGGTRMPCECRGFFEIWQQIGQARSLFIYSFSNLLMFVWPKAFLARPTWPSAVRLISRGTRWENGKRGHLSKRTRF